MTEADWLSGSDPVPLLQSVAGRLTDRQRLLFLAGCCRRIWELLTDHRFRRIVEVAEAVADGRATEQELTDASDALPPPGHRFPPPPEPLLREQLSHRWHGVGGVPPLGGVRNFHELPMWCRETYYAVAAVAPRRADALSVYCASAVGYHAGDQASERHPLRDEIQRLREDVRRGFEKAEDYHRRGAERLATETGTATRAIELDVEDRVTRMNEEIRVEAEAVRKRRIAEEKAAQAGLLRCLLGNPFRSAALDPRWLTPTVEGLVRGIDAEQAFDRL